MGRSFGTARDSAPRRSGRGVRRTATRPRSAAGRRAGVSFRKAPPPRFGFGPTRRSRQPGRRAQGGNGLRGVVGRLASSAGGRFGSRGKSLAALLAAGGAGAAAIVKRRRDRRSFEPIGEEQSELPAREHAETGTVQPRQEV